GDRTEGNSPPNPPPHATPHAATDAPRGAAAATLCRGIGHLQTNDTAHKPQEREERAATTENGHLKPPLDGIRDSSQAIDPPAPLFEGPLAAGVERERFGPEQHTRSADDRNIFEALPQRICYPDATGGLEQR